MQKNNLFSAKKLAFCGVSLALAFVLSYVKLWDLPSGGSVTLFSMFFVCVIGYFYGPVIGLISAFAYSLLQAIQGMYFLSIFQFLLDYTIAFTGLGVAGFFHNKKYGLQIGYLVAITVRFISSTLAGLIFYSEITSTSGVLPALYASAIYNGGYIYLEGLLTIILISLPPIYKAILRMKQQATN